MELVRILQHRRRGDESGQGYKPGLLHCLHAPEYWSCMTQLGSQRVPSGTQASTTGSIRCQMLRPLALANLTCASVSCCQGLKHVNLPTGSGWQHEAAPTSR